MVVRDLYSDRSAAGAYARGSGSVWKLFDLWRHVSVTECSVDCADSNLCRAMSLAVVPRRSRGRILRGSAVRRSDRPSCHRADPWTLIPCQYRASSYLRAHGHSTRTYRGGLSRDFKAHALPDTRGHIYRCESRAAYLAGLCTYTAATRESVVEKRLRRDVRRLYQRGNCSRVARILRH